MTALLKLPSQYTFLARENAPKLLVQALKLYGIKETLGVKDNPVILDWARECGIKEYHHDSVPWCGLGMAVIVKRAGYSVVNAPLWAANWQHFGKQQAIAMLGDILVFTRPGGGHVGLYVGEDATHYHVLGCNQSDAVTITRINKKQARSNGIRRPAFRIAQPPNVRVIHMGAHGPTNASLT